MEKPIQYTEVNVHENHINIKIKENTANNIKYPEKNLKL